MLLPYICFISWKDGFRYNFETLWLDCTFSLVTYRPVRVINTGMQEIMFLQRDGRDKTKSPHPKVIRGQLFLLSRGLIAGFNLCCFDLHGHAKVKIMVFLSWMTQMLMLLSHVLQQGQFTNPETPGYVGFANLPNQVHRKSVKKGFEFTLMVVGECHNICNLNYVWYFCMERVVLFVCSS